MGFKYIDDLSSFELINAIDGDSIEDKIDSSFNDALDKSQGDLLRHLNSITALEYHNPENGESFGLSVLQNSEKKLSLNYFYSNGDTLYYSRLCSRSDYSQHHEVYLNELKRMFPDFVGLDDPIYNHNPKQEGMFISKEQVLGLYSDHAEASKEWFEIEDSGVVDQDMEWLNNPSNFKHQSDYKLHYESPRNTLVILNLEDHDSLDEIESSIREVEFEKRLHWYEMKARPVSIGCQPDGFIEFDDDQGSNGIVAYDRPLTDKELDEFEMSAWQGKKKTYKDVQELDM